MPLWVIFVEDIWIITLYFSWDLWLCRCSPNWLLIVLFWDVTLCSLVNRYQPHSITFQKRVHTSSAIGAASWPVIFNSKHEEILGSVSPEANLANTNFQFQSLPSKTVPQVHTQMFLLGVGVIPRLYIIPVLF